MKRVFALAVVSVVFLAGVAVAADQPPALVAVQGAIQKVDKDSLTIQPRIDGKFGRAVVLNLTGTSKITTLSVRDMAGKPVATQRETDARDLKPGQVIAVTYTTLKDANVVLTAVVLPPPDK